MPPPADNTGMYMFFGCMAALCMSSVALSVVWSLTLQKAFDFLETYMKHIIGKPYPEAVAFLKANGSDDKQVVVLRVGDTNTLAARSDRIYLMVNNSNIVVAAHSVSPKTANQGMSISYSSRVV